MKIWREKEVEPKAWMCAHSIYFYCSPTFIGLIKQLIFEWEDDKHLAM